MKKYIISVVAITIFCTSSIILNAAVIEDINNDGKIGLEEAIYALQTIAGMRPQPETVNLGGVYFDTTSDQWPTDSYLSIPTSGVMSYSGYGNYAGFTITHEFFPGQSVRGVKCVKMHTSGDCGEDCWTEDWWFAFDTRGNCRVLKQITNGVLRFEASAELMPPVFMPKKISLGQTWFCLGTVLTVEDLNASFKDYQNLLKLKADMYGSEDIDYFYFQKGKGLVINHWYDRPIPTGSGWKLKLPSP